MFGYASTDLEKSTCMKDFSRTGPESLLNSCFLCFGRDAPGGENPLSPHASLLRNHSDSMLLKPSPYDKTKIYCVKIFERDDMYLLEARAQKWNG